MTDDLRDVAPADIIANPSIRRAVDLDITGIRRTVELDPVTGEQVITEAGGDNLQSSGYYIGGGFIITAAHNFAYDVNNPATSGVVRNLNSSEILNITSAEGIALADDTGFNDAVSLQGTIDTADGTVGAGASGFIPDSPFTTFSSDADVALARINESTIDSATLNGVDNAALIVYVDPSEAQGALNLAAYHGGNIDVNGVNLNGENLVQDNGRLEQNQYDTGSGVILPNAQIPGVNPFPSFGTFNSETANGYDAWVVDGSTASGLFVVPGASGGGVILTPDGDGVPSSGYYVAGVISGTDNGAANRSTTIQDFSQVYHNIANAIFGSPGAPSPAAFGRNALIADSNGDVSTSLAGTGFDEDIYTNVDYTGSVADGQTLTVTAAGGDDDIYISQLSENMNITGGEDADGLDVDILFIDIDVTQAADYASVSTGAESGTITANGNMAEYAEIEAVRIVDRSGAVITSTPIDFSNPATAGQNIIEAFNNISGQINNTIAFNPEGGDISVTPTALNLLPVFYAVTGVDPNVNVIPAVQPFFSGLSLNDIILASGVATTLTDTQINFGDGVSASDVTQAQDGDDLILTVANDDGTENTLTVEGVYADGNADEIAALSFADGSSAQLSDIPDTPPAPVMATEGDDILTGTPGDDVISALGGDDVLTGGDGADVLDGGTGTDTAAYTGSSIGVEINLRTGTAVSGEAAGDSFVSIENLTGSAFDDSLRGDTAANVLLGLGGDDYLSASGGGHSLRRICAR